MERTAVVAQNVIMPPPVVKVKWNVAELSSGTYHVELM